MGGYNSATVTTYDTVEVYDPALDDWTTLSPMPVARRGAYAASQDGKIYVFGGYGGATRVDIYHTSNGTWTSGAPIPAGYAYGGGCLLNGAVYLHGGAYGGTLNQKYTLSTNTWATMSPMLYSRMSHASAEAGDFAFAVSGSDYDTAAVTNVVQMYNPATGAWTRIADIPTARWDLSAASVDGRVYAMAGSQSMAKNEMLTPSDEFRSSFTTTSVVPIPQPDMDITKWAPMSARRGEAITYLVNYTNAGAGAATDVVISESYPAGVSFVSSLPAPSSGNGTWSYATVPSGASHTIAITVVVGGSASGALTNSVTLACDDTGGNPAPVVSASAVTYVFGVTPVLNLNTGEGFSTIQGAIGDANTLDGHTLLVSDGTYNEHVQVTKELIIIGESAAGTVVNGGGFGDVVKVTASNVRISGITAKGSGSDTSNKDAGIKLLDNTGCTVTGCTLADNNLIGVCFKRTAPASTYNVVSGCNFSRNQYGIYNEFTRYNNINNNTFFANSRGLYQNLGNHDVAFNRFYGNSFGILYSGSDVNVVHDNAFIANYYGFYMVSVCIGNTVFHNDFEKNTVQAVDDGSNAWDNGYPSGGNRWSNHVNTDDFAGAGQDVPGQDGIVDVEYYIDGDSVDDYPLVRNVSGPTFSLLLAPGWNLISIPTDEQDWSLEAVLGPISGSFDAVQTYDALSGTWKSHLANAPEWMSTLALLSPSSAYWVHITSSTAVTLHLYGDVRGSAVGILLLKGWNLAGYPSSAIGVTLSTSLAGTPWDIAQGFSAAMPYYLTPVAGTDQLSPGEGYWIHVTSDCVWTVAP